MPTPTRSGGSNPSLLQYNHRALVGQYVGQLFRRRPSPFVTYSDLWNLLAGYDSGLLEVIDEQTSFFSQIGDWVTEYYGESMCSGWAIALDSLREQQGIADSDWQGRDDFLKEKLTEFFDYWLNLPDISPKATPRQCRVRDSDDYRCNIARYFSGVVRRPAIYYGCLRDLRNQMRGHGDAYEQCGIISQEQSFDATFSRWIERKYDVGSPWGWDLAIEEIAFDGGIDIGDGVRSRRTNYDLDRFFASIVDEFLIGWLRVSG